MSALQRIALLLLAVFLIPALAFSVYEISSLTKDEKMIEAIYQKQLESILFSVNQVSDATLTSWAAKSEIWKTQLREDVPLTTGFYNLLSLNASILLAFVADTVQNESHLSYYAIDSLETQPLHAAVQTALQQNQSQIRQLVKYRKSGFQKVEALPTADTRTQHLIFVAEGSANPWQVGGFTIDTELFIEDVIGPHLNKISKEQFVLHVFDKQTGSRVYSTDDRDTTSLSQAAVAKDVWVFPNYTMAIQPKGASLTQWVRQRTTTNLLLLVGLDIILVIALVLAFRSIRKEVQLAQNKAEFVANVSHEIRTPLALISMFAETLEMNRATSDEKKKEYYAIINKETHRLSGIVNKILNFSQTESGKKKLHLQPVVLNEVVAEVLHTYDFHLTKKGFGYSVIAPEQVRVLADKEAVTEILVNLVDNSIKYSPDAKQLTVTLSTQNGFGCLAVTDQGAGISAADQKHIFDKFYRVSSGNLAKSRGTGLGLTLVKQLVDQQRGKISVQSAVGQGSTFTVHLPLT